MKFIEPGKVSIVIDGGFGSTGKGLLAGYLARMNPDYHIAASSASPNSGHTYKSADGTEFVVNHLPISGLVNPDKNIYMGPGSVIAIDTLIGECRRYDVAMERLHVHPSAAWCTRECAEIEALKNSGATSIGSTQKGVGQALINKLQRRGDVRSIVGQDKHLDSVASVSYADLNTSLESGDSVFLEVPQGMGLGVNSGFWPYVTARDVNVAQAMSDLGIHPSYLGKVAMSMRTYPIRVGHIYDDEGNVIGNSGPFYEDGPEMSWDELGVTPERTTVTGRVRRVAHFSWKQYIHACKMIRPDIVFMNFMNYLDPDFVQPFEQSLRNVTETVLGDKVEFLWGWGPNVEDIYEENQGRV